MVDVEGMTAMEGGQMGVVIGVMMDVVMGVVMGAMMGVVISIEMASMHFSILSPTYSSSASGPETIILPIVVQAVRVDGDPRPSSLTSRTIDISINNSITKQKCIIEKEHALTLVNEVIFRKIPNQLKAPLQCQSDADGRESATYLGKRDGEGGGEGGGGEDDEGDDDDVAVDHDENLQKPLSQIHTHTHTHTHTFFIPRRIGLKMRMTRSEVRTTRIKMEDDAQ